MAAAARGPSYPTDPPVPEERRQLRARSARRVFVALLALFLALGALGFFGVRTSTRTAAGGGYDVSVKYATVSRPGLATPLTVDVRRPGGFPEGLTVAVAATYFDAFDENGLSPTPAEETHDGDRLIWHFRPSTAERMTLSFDGRVEPGVQLRRAAGRVEILSGRTGPTAVSVAFSTFVMP